MGCSGWRSLGSGRGGSAGPTVSRHHRGTWAARCSRWCRGRGCCGTAAMHASHHRSRIRCRSSGRRRTGRHRAGSGGTAMGGHHRTRPRHRRHPVCAWGGRCASRCGTRIRHGRIVRRPTGRRCVAPAATRQRQRKCRTCQRRRPGQQPFLWRHHRAFRMDRYDVGQQGANANGQGGLEMSRGASRNRIIVCRDDSRKPA